MDKKPMSRNRQNYPDISDILMRKKERRQEIARRSFGEKIAMVERLRERLAPLKRMREERRGLSRPHGEEHRSASSGKT
jgi:hypothetical protein